MVIEFSCLSNKDGEAISHQREGVGLRDWSFVCLLTVFCLHLLKIQVAAQNFYCLLKVGEAAVTWGLRNELRCAPLGTTLAEYRRMAVGPGASLIESDTGKKRRSSKKPKEKVWLKLCSTVPVGDW